MLCDTGDFKKGRLSRCTLPNGLKPLKAWSYLWLVAKEESKGTEHEKDSTHHCWPEDGGVT